MEEQVGYPEELLARIKTVLSSDEIAKIDADIEKQFAEQEAQNKDAYDLSQLPNAAVLSDEELFDELHNRFDKFVFWGERANSDGDPLSLRQDKGNSTALIGFLEMYKQLLVNYYLYKHNGGED